MPFQKGNKLRIGLIPKNAFKKGNISWNKDKKGVMPISWTKGIPRNKVTKEKISLSLLSNKEKKSWNKGKKGLQISKNKGKKRPEVSGEKSGLWKGGITPINKKIRDSLEIKLWRKSCFERDNFTDQKTGQRGGDLVVHHINNFKEFHELRTSIENGITLSKKSHLLFHKKYGFKNNTKSQLLEFLNK